MKRIFIATLTSLMLVSCGGGGEAAPKETSTEEQPATQDEKVEQQVTETAPKEVSVTLNTIGETMTEMAYDPKQLSVPAGATVKLTLVNKASSEAMIHNAVFILAGAQSEITEAGLEAGKEKGYVPVSEKIIAATDLAQPGETVELEFTAPEAAGTYQYICTYPGHTSMKGILLVQ